MWSYSSSKDSILIPYSNIDYVRLSKGEATPNLDSKNCASYYHKFLDRYFNSEYLTIIFKKSGGYITIEDQYAFNQLNIVPDSKFCMGGLNKKDGK